MYQQVKGFFGQSRIYIDSSILYCYFINSGWFVTERNATTLECLTVPPGVVMNSQSLTQADNLLQGS